jgi:hypothetical protein
MSVHEGARRMMRARQWMSIIPLTMIILFWGIALVLSFTRSNSGIMGIGGIGIMVLSIYFAIPGAILWIAGWIVEGFAKDE